MTDHPDRIIYATIALSNMLKELHDRMWEAIIDGQHVSIQIEGSTVGEFIGHDGRVRVQINGQRVADVDISPARQA